MRAIGKILSVEKGVSRHDARLENPARAVKAEIKEEQQLNKKRSVSENVRTALL
jgi:hypothetical protein